MKKIIGLYSNDKREAEQLIRRALREGYKQPFLFTQIEDHSQFTKQFGMDKANSVLHAKELTKERFGSRADFAEWEAEDIDSSALPQTVAVVITSHNYGHFLGECLDSVLSQTRQADEIIVIDDASTDGTEGVVSEYLNRGVRYEIVCNKSAILSRWDGVLQAASEVVLFLDADDIIPQDFIECGLREFVHKQVGVVYCDHQHFGNSDYRTNFPPYSKDRLFKGPNFVSTCSFIRREALLICDAWNYGGTDMYMPEDYWMFQRIALDGWDFRKQSAVLKYRRHAESRSQTREKKRKDLNYYQSHGLEYHTVTLFIPLAGRAWAWERLSMYLDRQNWPHDQIRLVFCDTSQDPRFSTMVKYWIADCDYSDVRYFKLDAGTPGLADLDRRNREYNLEVKYAVCKIYNKLRLMIDTPYCWILEDDIIPPDDVLERLMKHFTDKVGAVTAPYQSRFIDSPVVWGRDDSEVSKVRLAEPQDESLSEIQGSGFGCLVVRAELIKKHMFPIQSPTQDLDPYFFESIEDDWKRLCDWSCKCQHWEEDQVYEIGV